jgi:hemoglobin
VSGVEQTAYERRGGSSFFVRLVGAFYGRVEADPVLRPLYPGSDLGPATYSELRGHPRLRMRHAPFAIDALAGARWLGHMRAALDAQALTPELDALLWSYFEPAASAMVNTRDGHEADGRHS